MVSLAYYQGWKQLFWLCPKVPEITHKHIQISPVNIWYISFIYYISSYFQGYMVNVLPFFKIQRLKKMTLIWVLYATSIFF